MVGGAVRAGPSEFGSQEIESRVQLSQHLCEKEIS